VIKLAQPGTFSDPLTEVLRNGARALLAQAVEAEVATFLGDHAAKLTADGHQRLVRHGHLPEREIMTGIGPVAVRCPRVRDRTADGMERIRFSSAILPPYARRSKCLEVLIPILYLKGISTGDFEEALAALLGKDAGGLSASTITRLKEAWVDEHARWLDRDLSAKQYVYFWVDGIYVQARLEDDAQCLLVIIGATAEGKKELVGLSDGIRESAQSWKELLLDLKRRGLTMAPQLAVADGALGFWKAIDEVWSNTRAQRCQHGRFLPDVMVYRPGGARADRKCRARSLQMQQASPRLRRRRRGRVVSTVSSLFLIDCGWRPFTRLPPALLFERRKDPQSSTPSQTQLVDISGGPHRAS